MCHYYLQKLQSLCMSIGSSFPWLWWFVYADFTWMCQSLTVHSHLRFTTRLRLCTHFYHPQQSYGKVMFYTCLSFCSQGGVCNTLLSRHPPTPEQTPPGQTPPMQCMLGYGQQAGGTHPTGMHSCLPL